MKSHAMAVLVMLLGVAWAAQAQPTARQPSVEKVREVLDSLLPDGVDLDQLQLERGQVKLSGLAVDTVKLTQFMRAVGDAGEFDAPALEDVANVDGLTAFTLVFLIVCPSAADAQANRLCGPVASSGKAPTVFKCLINGTVTYQGQRCPPGKDA